MNTNFLLRSFIAVVVGSSSIQAAEHYSLVSASNSGESATINLSAGDTAELNFSSSIGLVMVATIENFTTEVPTLRAISQYSNEKTYATNPIKIVGPGSFKIRQTQGGPDGLFYKSFATFEVNRAGTASNATAIPQEAGTTWQVILEASTDLVNWTPVAPGDYPSASPQRFFRTRLVKRS